MKWQHFYSLTRVTFRSRLSDQAVFSTKVAQPSENRLKETTKNAPKSVYKFTDYAVTAAKATVAKATVGRDSRR